MLIGNHLELDVIPVFTHCFLVTISGYFLIYKESLEAANICYPAVILIQLARLFAAYIAMTVQNFLSLKWLSVKL